MKNIFLVITAGITDINLLYEDSQTNELIRVFDNRSVRAFHDLIMETNYVFENPDEQNIQNNPRRYNNQPVFDENPRVYLPKIMPVLNQFDLYNQTLPQDQQIKVIGSVVLNTNREPVSQVYDSEPYAAGPLIAEYISERYQLAYNKDQEVRKGSSSWYDYLTSSEDIIGRETIDRAIIDHLTTILRSVCQISSNLDHPDSFYILYLSSGGLPIVKDFIREILNNEMMLSGMSNPWKHLLTRKYSRTNGNINFEKLFSHPVQYIELESIQIRKQIAAMILSGYIGSVGDIARMLQSDHYESRWVNKIIKLSSFFHSIYDWDIEDNSEDLMNTIQNITSYGEVLRCALRTEAALVRKDYSQFVINLISFKDMLMFQYLKSRIIEDHMAVNIPIIFNEVDRTIENVALEKLLSLFTGTGINGNSKYDNIISERQGKIKCSFTNSTFKKFRKRDQNERNNPLKQFIDNVEPARKIRNIIIHTDQQVDFPPALEGLRANHVLNNGSFLHSDQFVEVATAYIGECLIYKGRRIPWNTLYDELIDETIDNLKKYTMVMDEEG